MDEDPWLVERFEQYRPRLKAVAHRMLGSASEADDAVQEAWLRFSRSDTSDVDNLGGWLTTVVSRVCLTMLHSRRSRPEPIAGHDLPEPAASEVIDPEEETVLADSVGLALLVVLETLAPSERVALVLHDIFGVPFDEIGPIVGRSTPAARQLASRARRRVRGQGAPDVVDRAHRAILVEAFLAASRHGDFEGLLALLSPDALLLADKTAVTLGAAPETRGADGVASFCRKARGAQMALVDGQPGAVWMPHGQLRVVFLFTTTDEEITGIELVADPERLAELELVVTEDPH